MEQFRVQQFGASLLVELQQLRSVHAMSDVNAPYDRCGTLDATQPLGLGQIATSPALAQGPQRLQSDLRGITNSRLPLSGARESSRSPHIAPHGRDFF